MDRIIKIYTLLTLVAAIALMAAPAQAASCKFENEEIGSVVGYGRTHALAFEDAITQCFDKRVAKASSGRRTATSGVEEGLGMDSIDLCANLTCQ